MSEYSQYVTERQTIERLRVVVPREQVQAVLAELHAHNYQTVQSGPYTDSEIFPKCDMSRFLLLVEREITEVDRPLTFHREQLDMSVLRRMPLVQPPLPRESIDWSQETVDISRDPDGVILEIGCRPGLIYRGDEIQIEGKPYLVGGYIPWTSPHGSLSYFIVEPVYVEAVSEAVSA